ncbi:hypothetical protein GCM10027403_18010 [Arthrobacter tecti]
MRSIGNATSSATTRSTGLLAGAVLAVLLAGCGSPGSNPGADLTPAPTDSTDSSTEPTDPAESASGSPTDSESAMPTDSPKPSPTLPSDPAAVGTAMLNISIKQNPDSEATQYVLECTPDGVGEATTLPNPEAACAAVKELGAAFFTAKPDPNRMCTQQYGGPQTATVKGTVDGKRVSASFSATDGCEIGRWNALESILGTSGAR